MAIVPSGVSVPAQSKELDNNVVTTSYGTVYRQVVNLADPETPTNYQRVGSNGAYVDVRNVVSLPLPTGASTAALQTSGNASLTSINTKLPSLDGGYVPVTIKNSSIEISNDAGNPVPVSGTFWQATQPVSAVSLPLPTGAATETTVAGLLTNTQLRASAVETTKKTSSFNHITTNKTTTVKSGAGVLRRIVINTKGSGANTLTIYDNTTGSGTVIGDIDTVNGVSGHFEYGVSFSTGLTIVTANGTAADVTVIYE